MPKKYFKGYRDAGNGQFIKEEEANKKPKNQVIEEKIPKPGFGVESKSKKK